MQSSKILPSETLPEYMKLDVGVGTSAQMPFVSALDEFIRQLNHQLSLRNLSVDPNHHSTEQKRLALKRLGIQSLRLSDGEVEQLYVSRDQLRKCNLESIGLLASVYFPGSCLTRSRRFEPGAKGPRIRLVDTRESDHTLFVHLKARSARTDEFVLNTKALLPSGKHVVLVDPLEQTPHSPCFRLVGGKLQERRLPCPISRK